MKQEQKKLKVLISGSIRLILMMLAVGFCSAGGRAQNGLGSTSCKTDVTKLDDRFQFMSEWATAGVIGGVPEIKKVRKKIGPHDDVQQAVDEVARKGGGVLLLKNGEYIIRSTVNLKTGVIIRGENKDSVLLSVKIHGYHFKTGKPRQCALLILNGENVGIENLTMKYTDAGFEPLDKDSLNGLWEKAIFHQKELRDTSLFVEHIWFRNSRNCWVQNCNLLWAGSDPLKISDSEHITCRNNFVDRSYNKNDGGMGYYNLINSRYILITGEHIKRIRHFAIQNNSKYNVVYNNYMEVDINFHNDDDGYNLIERNTIVIPTWHSWHCFQRGAPRQHKPPGKWNIVFNNNAVFKTGEKEASDTNKVYVMNTEWAGSNAIPAQVEPPKGNTFYAVSCDK